MRGKNLLVQPYVTPGHSFCWNGELYAHNAHNTISSTHDSSTSTSTIDATTDTTTDASASPLFFDVANELQEEATSDTVQVMNLIQDVFDDNQHDGDNNDDNDYNVTREQQQQQQQQVRHAALAILFHQIQGEYSFILYSHGDTDTDSDDNNDTDDDEHEQRDQGCVYFGRDPLGRRSLLMSYQQQPPQPQPQEQQHEETTDASVMVELDSFLLSSVIPTLDEEEDKQMLQMEEIPAGRVYRLDLQTGQLTYLPVIMPVSMSMPVPVPAPDAKTAWNEEHEYQHEYQHEGENVPLHLLKTAKRLHHCLDLAVRRRVLHAPIPAPAPIPDEHEHGELGQRRCQASVAVLFSGGVDSVVLAALCHNHVPLDQPIDLINVAFATEATASQLQSTSSQSQSQSQSQLSKINPYSQSPDRQAALLSLKEMKVRFPTREWRFIAVNVEYSEVLKEEALICQLIAPRLSTMDFNIGTAFWFATRGRGEIEGEGMNVDVDVDVDVEEGEGLGREHLRFGGDAAAVTGNALALACGTPGCQRKARGECTFRTCHVCCSSNFHRRINQYLGGRADVCSFHNQDRSSRKNKKKGVKDKGNGAKKGIGMQYSNRNSEMVQETITTPQHVGVATQQKKKRSMYTSRARVVLVGIGADEQMAGYGRHRVTFERGGYGALRKELKMEKSRLWTRNLGRDDRCISHHGKEARFPFLDENVVAYLNSLDVTELCDMTKPQGLGDKMILRLVAKHIGVTQCSGLVKRAIQFGSRIAKCSDLDRFGSSRKASGSAKHTAKEQ